MTEESRSQEHVSTPCRDALLLMPRPLHEVVTVQDNVDVEQHTGELGFVLVLDIAVVEGSLQAGKVADARATPE